MCPNKLCKANLVVIVMRFKEQFMCQFNLNRPELKKKKEEERKEKKKTRLFFFPLGVN
jgi:hypothetical protein